MDPNRSIEYKPSSLVGQEQESSPKQVIQFLRSHEKSFMAKLKEFAQKNGYGHQQILPSAGWEPMFDGRGYIPDLWKMAVSPDKGEFTAVGLCSIASSVIEKVLRDKYGESIEVVSVFVCTNDMDIETGRDLEERFLYPHHIVRFRVRGGDWYTIDAAYRQFQIKVKPDRILITPTKNEPKLYNYNQWYRRMQEKDPDNAFKYLPQEKPKDALFQMFDRDIASGKLNHIKREDYQSLFDVFKD